MTDGEVVAIARRIEEYNWRINDLINQVRESDHPHALQLYAGFEDNGMPIMAWATHVVRPYLVHPERWEMDDYGIKYKQGMQERGGQR